MEAFPQMDPYEDVMEMAEDARFRWMHHDQVQLLEQMMGGGGNDGPDGTATEHEATTDNSGANSQQQDHSVPADSQIT